MRHASAHSMLEKVLSEPSLWSLCAESERCIDFPKEIWEYSIFRGVFWISHYRKNLVLSTQSTKNPLKTLQQLYVCWPVRTAQFAYFDSKIKYKVEIFFLNFKLISKNHEKRKSIIEVQITMFGFLFSDLNFYQWPYFFDIFWNQHKIPNKIVHFICPTTKFYLSTWKFG